MAKNTNPKIESIEELTSRVRGFIEEERPELEAEANALRAQAEFSLESVPGGIPAPPPGRIMVLPEIGDTGKFLSDFVNQPSEWFKTPTFNPQGNFYRAPNTPQQTPVPTINPLANYTSYNYNIKLGVLTNDELNHPDKTIMKNDPKFLLTKTGGGIGLHRALTAYESDDSVLDFFVDNLEIKSVISPNPKSKHSTATNITFNVTEPYSMGLFLQVMEASAIAAGHKNYIEAPYVLIVEWKGETPDGNFSTVPGTRRVITFKWVSAEFNVTASGSEYSMICVPYNEQAFTDSVQTIPVDLEITGRTASEMLQTGFSSLAAGLNTHLLKRIKESPDYEPDEYIIIFPKSRSSSTLDLESKVEEARATTASGGDETTSLERFRAFSLQRAMNSVKTGLWSDQVTADNVADWFYGQTGYTLQRSKIGEAIKQFNELDTNQNILGRSKINIGNRFSQGAMVPPPLKGYAMDEKTGLLENGKVTIDPEKRAIKFKKGEKIQTIIEEILILSDYGKNIGPEADPDENGMVEWFRIDTQVFNINNKKHESLTGKPPRVFVFRVMPYYVHHSVFMSPNEPPKYNGLINQAVKKYDYLYTGQNTEILDFDLTFRNAFFQALAPDLGNNTTTKSVDYSALDPSDRLIIERAQTAIDEMGDGRTTGTTLENNSNSAGAIEETPAIAIARRFNNAIVNSSADLLTGTLSIIGDPYYFADSGLGNYLSSPSELANVDALGKMDYQSGQVDIEINFKTPIDIKADGNYSFPQDYTDVDSFSGLYMVTIVTSSLRDGQFTQELELVKRPNFKQKDRAPSKPTGMTQANRVVENKISEALDATSLEDDLIGLIDNPLGNVKVPNIAGNLNLGDIENAKAQINSAVGAVKTNPREAFENFASNKPLPGIDIV